jgi:hypothetical protein
MVSTFKLLAEGEEIIGRAHHDEKIKGVLK